MVRDAARAGGLRLSLSASARAHAARKAAFVVHEETASAFVNPTQYGRGGWMTGTAGDVVANLGEGRIRVFQGVFRRR